MGEPGWYWVFSDDPRNEHEIMRFDGHEWTKVDYEGGCSTERLVSLGYTIGHKIEEPKDE